MIDQKELESAIAECVDNPSSANVCQRLASYYVIRDHLFDNDTGYSAAASDSSVLPAYSDFANAKRQFQMGEGSERRMIDTLNALLIQIKRLMQTLYANAQTNEEKSAIVEAISQFNIGNF